MPYDVGVLIVHGMGSQRPDYADQFIHELAHRIRRNKVDPERVAFEAAHWADVLHDREDDLWNRMKSGGRLRYDDLRRFLLSAFGDAVAYQRTGMSGQNTYGRIHEEVYGHLERLHQRLGGDKPLVAIGHSLGSAILSNYIWDEQTSQGYGKDPFTRMETLTGLVTFGSTLPLFTLPHNEPRPIVFPPPQLAGNVRTAARWLNFYDPDDIMGWPLKPINRLYDEAVTEDRPIEVGNLFASFTPLSHQHYWTDEDFVWPVAKLVADVAKATGP